MNDEINYYKKLMVYHNDLIKAYSGQMKHPESDIMIKYLEDNVLDYVIISDLRHDYHYCELVIGYGNPNVYICTREQKMEYWFNGKKTEISIPDVICR